MIFSSIDDKGPDVVVVVVVNDDGDCRNDGDRLDVGVVDGVGVLDEEDDGYESGQQS